MEATTYGILVVLTLAIAYVVFRVIVRRDYRRKGKLTPFSTFMEYVAILSWVYLTYQNRPADWPTVHVGTVLEITGSILFYGGMAITLFNLAALGIRRSHGQEVNRLKQSGFYRATRNPQAVAFFLAIVGYVILWPAWRGVVALMMLAVLLHLMVITEEEHLRDVFGEEYVRYCGRVPRYIGVLRRS